jgi:serine/threonine protein kinase
MQCGTCGHDNPDGARFCAGCGVPLSRAGTDPIHPLLGKVVGGRYRIVGLLGEGGMGVVYKAEQQLGSAVRKVAVKTLHAELSRDPAITARFHREVGTIAQLEHPNTVRVYDFGSTDDGTLYIAMEFLDGQSLSRVIQSEGALAPRRVEHLLQQVAGSLDEAHRQGIVHRDLKPDNVLLIQRAGEKEVVKLVDFGIAARTEQAAGVKEQKLTQQGMVLGTPPYMSPEQFSGKPLDARSDIYSLGIVTYEMLTGELPFQADTPWQWAAHHLTSTPRSFDDLPRGSQLPEALRRAVLHALAKSPEQRPKSAGDFRAEFSAALSEPATAPALAGAKTEAMSGVSSLAVAPTQAMAEADLARQPPVASPAALPPAPTPARSSANRGLIYGLAASTTVLLLAMGAVALRGSGEPRPEPNARARRGTASSSDSPAAESEAEPGALKSERTSSHPREPGRPKPVVNRSNGADRPGTSSAGSGSPAGARTAPEAASTKPAAPAPPPPSLSPEARLGHPSMPSAPASVALPEASPFGSRDADPCTACLQAAGNLREFNLAATMYQRCTNAELKAQCSARVAAVLPNQAEYAANNGRCQQAKAMQAAALEMGVPESRLTKVEAVCK